MKEAKAVVLVVDDEESMRYFLKKTLRREGYEVIEAADGPSALAAAASGPPDVALVDVRMPGMDGVALMRALRTTHTHLPVVLMTAYGSVENALAAMKHGATDYVTKPFRVDEIRTTVAKALAERASLPRPPTLRNVQAAAEPLPEAAARGEPRDPRREHLPARNIAAFLRERCRERELPLAPDTASGDLGLRELTRLAETVYVDELLRLTSGNVSRAAEIAGITRPNMHRKIVDLGLAADAYRPAHGAQGGTS